MKTLCSTVAALGLALSLCGAAAAATTKVAVIAPLTGTLAAAGREIELTSRAWAQELNARAGAGSQAVELLVLDDQSSADGARAAARRALSQGAALVMNCFGSVACMAIAQETKAAGVPLLGAIAGDERLRGPDLPNVFTTRGGARDEIEVILKYLQGLDMAQFAVVVQDDGFGQSYKRALDEALIGRPALQAVASVALDPKAPNHAEAAAAVAAKASKGVVLLTNTANSLGMIEALAQAGYRGLYFNLAAQANPVFVSRIGKLTADNKLVAAFVTTTPSPLLPMPGVTEYREMIARSSQTPQPSYLGLESYINASLAALVMQRDARLSPDSLVRTLTALNGTRVAGLPVRFDPARRQALRWLDLSVVTRDGKVRSY